MLLSVVFCWLICLGSSTDVPPSCEGAACSPIGTWADMVDVEEQALEMLQVKVKAVQQRDSPPACDMPDMGPRELPTGKACPAAGQHINGVWGVSCLNRNTPYWSMSDAWKECAKVAECGAILSTTDGKYYLRRMSDPDLPQEDTSRAFSFQCAERDMYLERKKREKEQANVVFQDQVDGEYKAKCPMPARPNMMPFGKNCPEDGENGLYGTTCLQGNKPYFNQNAAWVACAETEGCGAIMQTADGRFFLRRTSDPDAAMGDNAYTIEFSCAAVVKERAKREEDRRTQERMTAERLLKTAEAKCPIPQFQGNLPVGKACPKLEGGGYECFNGNTAYSSFAEAWIACAEIQGCGAILKHNNSKFYLRRASDPDMPQGSPSYSITFACQALQGHSLREVAQAEEIEELKRELSAAKKLQRYDQCWDAGYDQSSRDAKCEGDLKCSRRGFDGRHFGDCQWSHCCSKELLPRYAECWYAGHDDAARDAGCDGDLKCSRKGFNGRNFGDCEFKHCCSVEGANSEPAKAEAPKVEPADLHLGQPAQAQQPQEEQSSQQMPDMSTAVLQDQPSSAEVQDQPTETMQEQFQVEAEQEDTATDALSDYWERVQASRGDA